VCPPPTAPAAHVLAPLAQQSAALAASSTAAVHHQQGQHQAPPQQVICMASTLVCVGLRRSNAVTKEQAQTLEAAGLSAAGQSSVDTLLGGNQRSGTAVRPALLVGALWVLAKLGGCPRSSCLAAVLDRLLAAPAAPASAADVHVMPPLKLAAPLQHTWTSCHHCSCQGYTLEPWCSE
jgi:hypothetical protein